MFSNIPLPQIPQGGFGMQALQQGNALTQQNLANRILRTQAQYAPLTSLADASSKIAYANYLPYQLQAQVLANPMLYYAFKDNPELLNKLMGGFLGSIPQPGQLLSNAGIPNNALPNAQDPLFSGGLLSGINKLFQGNPPQGTEQTTNGLLQTPAALQQSAQPPIGTSAGGSPLVPSSQGGFAGLIAKQTAPGTVSPFKENALLPNPSNPNEIINVPTGRMSTQLQTQIVANKRVEPQLERLASEWEPFLNLKGRSELLGARVGNFLEGTVSPEILSSVGLKPNSNLVSQYGKAKSTLKTAPESLVKAYGLNATNETLARLEEAIEPVFGETKDGYKNRIKQTLAELRNEQNRISENAISQGIKVPSQEVGSQVGTEPEAQNLVTLEGGLRVPKSFASKEAFNDWFKAQPKQTQLAYREYIRSLK